MKKRNNKGFTLIELLIVVAIIGIIVAIAIPNLLNAIQRAKQKRSMADMRSAGTAAEAYAVDFNHYPAAAAVSYPSGITALPTTSFGTATDTFGYKVAPTYIRVLPLVDGWQSFFVYGTGTSSQQHYVIASAGKNGVFDGLITTAAETTNFNDDIIFVDGQFINYPAGAQR
jgi:type II secretion system protein G